MSAMLMELAHRVNDGLSVTLFYDRSSRYNRETFPMLVRVNDSRTGEDFTLKCETGQEGLTAFYHPFSVARAALNGGRVVA